MVRRVGLGSTSQWRIYRDITEQSTPVITQTMFVFSHDSCVCLYFLTRIAYDCVYSGQLSVSLVITQSIEMISGQATQCPNAPTPVQTMDSFDKNPLGHCMNNGFFGKVVFVCLST